MRGGVRKKGDTWYYYFDVGKVDGKRKKIERKGGSTSAEAEKALRKALTEFEKCGAVIDESNISVSDYFDYWYKDYVLINCKYNTQQAYKIVIDRHIKPALGIYKLKSLTPAMLQNFINNKYKNGFTKSSISNFYGVLSGAIKRAVYPYQFIKENPMIYVNMPKMQNTKKTDEDLKIITLEEFNKIVERFPEGSNFYIPVEVAFNTGMRAAEVCGLTWNCIDFENKSITVDKIIYKKDGIWMFGTPKTESSERKIELGDTLLNILEKYKKIQDKNKKEYGKYYANKTYIYNERNKIYTSNDLVCTKENGDLISTESLKYLSRVVNYELGINFHFHSLRHTHASMLLESGTDYKEIQERLGHNKLSTTMDTYSHVTKKLKKSTIDKFENYIHENNLPPKK